MLIADLKNKAAAVALGLASLTITDGNAAEAKAAQGKSPLALTPSAAVVGWQAVDIFGFEKDATRQSIRQLGFAGSGSVLAIGSAIKEKKFTLNTVTCLDRSNGEIRWSAPLEVQTGKENESINESICTTNGKLIVSSRLTDLTKENGESSGRYRLRVFDVATGNLGASRDFSLLDPSKNSNSATDNARGSQAKMRISVSNDSGTIFLSTPSYCGQVFSKDLKDVSPFHKNVNLSAITTQVGNSLFFVDYKTPDVLNIRSIGTGKLSQLKLPGSGSINHIEANGLDGVVCLYTAASAKQMVIGYDSKTNLWSKPVDLGVGESSPWWLNGNERPWLLGSRNEKNKAVEFKPLSISSAKVLDPTTTPTAKYLGSLALSDRRFAICESEDGGTTCRLNVYEIAQGKTGLLSSLDYRDPNTVFNPSTPPIIQHNSGRVYLSVNSGDQIRVIEIPLSPNTIQPATIPPASALGAKADISKK